MLSQIIWLNLFKNELNMHLIRRFLDFQDLNTNQLNHRIRNNGVEINRLVFKSWKPRE